MTACVRLLLDVRPDAPDIVVRALAEWSRTVGWPSAEARDLLFAVREAVCNSVTHAYRGRAAGRVGVEAVVRRGGRDGDHIELTVSDTGCWKPPPDTGEPGYGIPLMRAATAGLVIYTGASGTEVRLRSTTVPRGTPALGSVRSITAAR